MTSSFIVESCVYNDGTVKYGLLLFSKGFF